MLKDVLSFHLPFFSLQLFQMITQSSRTFFFFEEWWAAGTEEELPLSLCFQMELLLYFKEFHETLYFFYISIAWYNTGIVLIKEQESVAMF